MQSAEQEVRLLNRAIILQPNSISLHSKRAESLLRLGDTASAVSNIRHAIRLAEAKAQAQKGGAAAEVGEGGDAWARSALQERLAGLLDLRAAALMQAGEHEAAVPCLTEAIELAPERPSYLLHRALAYTGCESPALALRDLEAVSTYGGGGANSELSIADSHFLRAKLLMLQKQLADARAAVDAALELQPLHAPALALRATMDECSEIYASEATKLALLGLASDAATNLQHARELRPADASLRIKFAMTLRQQGKLHEAVEVLEGVAREGGDAVAALARRSLALAYNDVGVAQAMSGQLEPAVRSFGLAIEVGGADAMAAPYANRADCFRQLQRPTDAIDDYERAAGLAAAEPELHWQIQTRMAMLHNDTGLRLYNHAQPRKAALAFSRAIECNPRVARFYLNRAEATMQLSRYELARDDLLVSLRFDPANTRARSLLASLCP